MPTLTSSDQSLSKSEEIAALKNLADALGPNSYVGPWLSSVLLEVESDIRCDLLPAPSISETRKAAEEILREARGQAHDIRLKADLAFEQRQREIAALAERRSQLTSAIESAQKILRMA